MHGDEDAAILDAAFVALGLVLGNAHADECSDEAADCSANAETRECAHDGTRSDERTDAGDRERADAGEKTERAADDTADAYAGRGAFRRLGVLLGRELTRAVIVGHEDGDVLIGETGRDETVDCRFCC